MSLERRGFEEKINPGQDKRCLVLNRPRKPAAVQWNSPSLKSELILPLSLGSTEFLQHTGHAAEAPVQPGAGEGVNFLLTPEACEICKTKEGERKRELRLDPSCKGGSWMGRE